MIFWASLVVRVFAATTACSSLRCGNPSTFGNASRYFVSLPVRVAAQLELDQSISTVLNECGVEMSRPVENLVVQYAPPDPVS